MNRKILSLFISIVFVAIAMAPAFAPNTAQAYFWRNAGDGSAAATSPADPIVFSWGYGYGSSGFGWGYGYGYSYYVSDKSGTGYMGVTTAASGTAGSGTTSTTGTVSGNVDFSALISGGAITLGGGALTLQNTSDTNIQVVLPTGVTITGIGWDGIFQAPSVVTDTSVAGYPSSTPDSDVIMLGSSSVSLTLSSAATVYLPVNNHTPGRTYTVYRVPPGSSTPVSAGTASSCTGTSTAGRYICSFTTTSFSMFYGTAAASTTTTASASTGGGGGGGGLCKDKVTKKTVTGTADTQGYCLVTKKTEKQTPKTKVEQKAEEQTKITKEFKDISGHWAKDYIETLRAAGVVQGKQDGKYAPNDKLTRAELTKIALNVFSIPVDSSVSVKPFKDVDTNAWYAPYVAKAKELNILQGYQDKTFRPNQPITRAEAIKILLVAAGVEVPIDGIKELAAKGWTYIDFIDTPINAWFAPYVNFAKTHNIVSGYGNGLFGPQNHILRGEVAKIAVKTVEELSK